jgi:hypothetical protein
MSTPTSQSKRREQLLAALEAHDPGFAKIVRPMDPEGVPNARIEEVMIERGIPVPPEPVPIVTVLAHRLKSSPPLEPTPALTPLAGGADAPLPEPTYDHVVAAFREHLPEKAWALDNILPEAVPDLEARRVLLLATLRENVANWLRPRRVGDGRAETILSEASRAGKLQAVLDGWDRGEVEPTPSPSALAAPDTGEAKAPVPPSAAAVEPNPSPAMLAAKARSKMGAKGASRARASRVRETQRRAVAQAGTDTEPNYQEGGWMKLPNLALDLIAVMPGPVTKAYLVACRLADAKGDFTVSHQRLAEWIGSQNRTQGERAMRRLVDAGLVHQSYRGGPGRANGYRLASLARLDLDAAKATLALPLTESGAAKHRQRGVNAAPACA